MMKVNYLICDVFTDQLFGGNPLAVIPDATGLNSAQMQKIAREFNFSESTFVFPPQSDAHHKQVRIFTPSREVPFAGHPNVGTAYALIENGDLVLQEGEDTIRFEEKAGLVPIKVKTLASGQKQFCLTAPEPLYRGKEIPVELVAQALSLSVDDIRIDVHKPLEASVGLAFVMVEVASLKALQSAKIDIKGFEGISDLGVMPDLHVYTQSEGEFDIRCRMFAPFDGVNEDPATGSANSALAALLATLDPKQSGRFDWRIAQGVEMARPSVLDAFAEKEQGKLVSCGVVGQAVMFSEGSLWVPE